MAYAITDFSFIQVGYTDDGGTQLQLRMRNVYSGASGLGTLTNSTLPNMHGPHARRRYIYSLNGGSQGHPVERHYPGNLPGIVKAPAAPGTIDGVAFTLKGYRGEKRRAGVGF